MSGVRIDTVPLAQVQAELLSRLARGGDREVLARVVTALGAARDEGHVCLALDEWTATPPADDEAPRPDLDAVRRALTSSGVVALAEDAEATPRPLVLDARARLYALRHFRAEQRIAAFVARRLDEPTRHAPDAVRAALDAVGLLPDEASEPDWQLAAVVAAAARSLTLLCGGPGTGKTTTVAKMLSVLLHLEPALRVAVAAPTGKAAARLGEALAQRAAEAAGRAAALTDLEPRTLHRLLGYLPLDDAFRFGARTGRTLPYDLVVVDEVSMVDPALFAELCAALPERARLVLVGDKDQLAAVAAGQVLGDLCRAARPEAGLGPELAAFVADATGMRCPTQERAAPIANATVALWTNHRFGQQPGIGGFAQALMQRRPERALAAFDAGHDDLVLEPDLDAGLRAFEPQLLHLLDAAESGDPDRALAAIPHARILTAQRAGPTGAADWNRRVEQRLAALGRLRPDEPLYVGRPVLVTSNDQQNRIWNGDLGVVGRNAAGEAEVWIRDQYGATRRLSPRRLPAHETAWAMTVHKAQGSEFDHVLLVLPDREGPLLQASLVYTGVTRARARATVGCDRALLQRALARWPTRRSGLGDALTP